MQCLQAQELQGKETLAVPRPMHAQAAGEERAAEGQGQLELLEQAMLAQQEGRV